MNKKIASIVSLSFLGLLYSSSALAELKPFYEESNNGWHCGYKNDIGEIVVPIKKYEDCGEFSDGLAYVGMIAKPLVQNDNGGHKHLQGFIDQTGRLVIPIEHEAVEDLVGTNYESFSEGLVVVYRNGKYGYMNKQRELVIPYRYEHASWFKDGLATVTQYGKYGAINQLGDTVIPLKFDYLGNYSEGLAIYSEKNHWNDESSYGYVDKKGDISIKASWSDANSFSEGLAAVMVGGYGSRKWGVIDKTGVFVVKPEYDEIIIQPDNDVDTDVGFVADGYYRQGIINMYKYTDASNPYESSVTRYILNRQGDVIGKKFYSDRESVINESIESNGL